MLKAMDYRWRVAVVYVLAIFMNLLDLTITNTALPVMARQFRAVPAAIAWVATSYLLSVAVCIPVSGWLGDRFGTKRTFSAALATFTLGSLLCGLAPTLGSLIAFRVLQGVGGGLLTPVGAAMLFRAFPPAERARVSSLVTVPAVVAPALGPVVGGYLVQHHSWPAIFLVNVPIGALGLLFAALALREERVAGTGRLDLPGFALATVGLGAFIHFVSQAGEHGLTNARVLGFGLVGLASLAAFVAVELRVPRPMIDLRLYGDRLFAAGNVVLFFVNGGFFGVTFLLPQLLQAERGLGPLASGMTTFPTALGIMISAPLIARIYPVVGPRRLVLTGVLIAAGATLLFRRIDFGTSLWQIRLQVLPLGFAFGCVFIPLQTASFAAVGGEKMGQATAAYNAVRQVATSCGVALLATVLSARLGHYGATLGDPGTRPGALAAFHDTFVASACLDLLAGGAAVLISDRLATRTMRPRPAVPASEPPAATPLLVE